LIYLALTQSQTDFLAFRPFKDCVVNIADKTDIIINLVILLVENRT